MEGINWSGELVKEFLDYALSDRVIKFIAKERDEVGAGYLLVGTFRQKLIYMARQNSIKFSEKGLKSALKSSLEGATDIMLMSRKRYSDLVEVSVRNALNSSILNGFLERDRGALGDTDRIDKMVVDDENGQAGLGARVVASISSMGRRVREAFARIETHSEHSASGDKLTERLDVNDTSNGEGEFARATQRLYSVGTYSRPRASEHGVVIRLPESAITTGIYRVADGSLRKLYDHGFSEDDLRFLDIMKKGARDSEDFNAKRLVRFIVDKANILRDVYSEDMSKYGEALRNMLDVIRDLPYNPHFHKGLIMLQMKTEEFVQRSEKGALQFQSALESYNAHLQRQIPSSNSVSRKV